MGYITHLGPNNKLEIVACCDQNRPAQENTYIYSFNGNLSETCIPLFRFWSGDEFQMGFVYFAVKTSLGVHKLWLKRGLIKSSVSDFYGWEVSEATVVIANGHEQHFTPLHVIDMPGQKSTTAIMTYDIAHVATPWYQEKDFQGAPTNSTMTIPYYAVVTILDSYPSMVFPDISTAKTTELTPTTKLPLLAITPSTSSYYPSSQNSAANVFYIESSWGGLKRGNIDWEEPDPSAPQFIKNKPPVVEIRNPQNHYNVSPMKQGQSPLITGYRLLSNFWFTNFDTKLVNQTQGPVQLESTYVTRPRNREMYFGFTSAGVAGQTSSSAGFTDEQLKYISQNYGLDQNLNTTQVPGFGTIIEVDTIDKNNFARSLGTSAQIGYYWNNCKTVRIEAQYHSDNIWFSLPNTHSFYNNQIRKVFFWGNSIHYNSIQIGMQPDPGNVAPLSVWPRQKYQYEPLKTGRIGDDFLIYDNKQTKWEIPTGRIGFDAGFDPSYVSMDVTKGLCFSYPGTSTKTFNVGGEYNTFFKGDVTIAWRPHYQRYFKNTAAQLFEENQFICAVMAHFNPPAVDYSHVRAQGYRPVHFVGAGNKAIFDMIFKISYPMTQNASIP